MPGSRPPKWTDPKEVEEKANKYFSDCDAKDEPYTITGLALALDTCRQTLLNYQEKSEFLDTIKKAKLKIENYAEKKLYGNSVAGVIFNLKNNYGWVDKQERGFTDIKGQDLARDIEALRKIGIDISESFDE